MGFSDFVGNERIVNALRGALRAERVPHALLFTGASGVGKYTLARMFAQAATCERMKDDFCGECDTCKRVALLADPRVWCRKDWQNAVRARTRRWWSGLH